MPTAGTAVDESNINNLRDILSVYNKMTEACFTRCASNFNQVRLTTDEDRCVENCGNKFVRGNHSIMATFMEIQSRKQQQLMDDATQQQQRQQHEQLQQMLMQSSNSAPAVADVPSDRLPQS